MSVFRLHRMHETLTILTNVHGVSLSCSLKHWRCVQCTPRAVFAGLFGTAFVKLLWPLIILGIETDCSVHWCVCAGGVRDKV